MSYVAYCLATKSELKTLTGFHGLAKLNLITILLHKLLIVTLATCKQLQNTAVTGLVVTGASLGPSAISELGTFWCVFQLALFLVQVSKTALNLASLSYITSKLSFLSTSTQLALQFRTE
jgi:hypothetical protein